MRTDQQFTDGNTFISDMRSRAFVDQLPNQITDQLGTDRIEKVEKVDATSGVP